MRARPGAGPGGLCWGCLALGLTITAPSLTGPRAEADGGILHVVQRGETLWDNRPPIRRQGRSFDRLNELSDPNRLVVGQKLVIREGEARVHVVQPGETLTSIARFARRKGAGFGCASMNRQSERLSVGQQIIVSPRVQRTHVVERGDTLWDIARRYEVTRRGDSVGQRVDDPGRLRIGQNLVIPAIGGGDELVAVPAVAGRPSGCCRWRGRCKDG